jgi:hypothetical protein
MAKNRQFSGLYKRDNGIWYYCRTINGRSFRISTKTRDHDEATKFAKKHDEVVMRARGMQNVVALHNAVVKAAVPGWEAHVHSMVEVKSSWLNVLYQNCETRARYKKLSFFLTKQAYLSLLLGTGGVCSLTGIRFSFEKPVGAKI